MATLVRPSFEPPGQTHSAAKRIPLSLPWFGLSAGVVLRLYRWAALSLIAPRSWGLWLASIVVGVALLCGFAVAHLAQHPLRTWRWRAPALGAFIALGEGATCFVLTLAQQEQLGSGVATLADWPATALGILASRVLIVTVFGAALAAAYYVLKKAA